MIALGKNPFKQYFKKIFSIQWDGFNMFISLVPVMMNVWHSGKIKAVHYSRETPST